MHTYGEARLRNPFGEAPPDESAKRPAFRTGSDLAKHLARKAGLDAETAAQMKRDAANLRKTKRTKSV